MTYYQNVYHGHHIRAIHDLGDKSNTQRKNGSWIYANHHNPYILTVNCDLPNHWICCNRCLECSGCFGTTPQGGWKTFHQHGWIWSLYTIMVLSHQYDPSTACHPWITYMCIPSFSSYHYDQIQSRRNHTPAMEKVGRPVGRVSLFVAWLEGSVL